MNTVTDAGTAFEKTTSTTLSTDLVPAMGAWSPDTSITADTFLSPEQALRSLQRTVYIIHGPN
ncbi:MAG: hypothetical protein HKN08_03740, partial [Gammaproteobacteria bacterium]|nr:hypothetical protein [Gammaproteobacteria bacterium]